MDQSLPSAMPSSPPSPPILHLTRGQSLWLCLAPGSALRTARGEVTVRFAPQVWGQPVYAPAATVLKAGADLAWPGQGQAAWVQVENLLNDRAEIQLWESAQAPSLLRRAWQGLQATLAGRSRSRTGRRRNYDTALHPTR